MPERLFSSYSSRYQIILKLVLLSAGVLSATFGLKGFLLPSHFLDGGVMGISLIIERLTGWDLSLLVLLINLPFIALGYHQVSKRFAAKTLLAIALLSLALYGVSVPIVSDDKLLISIFGGFFLGLGIGLTIRGGGVIDGTEVLALYLSRRFKSTIGDIILIINILIFGVAAFLFSMETALYAILTYFCASKTIDFIVSGIEEYTGVTIISDQAPAIREAILLEMERGVTIYKGRKGYTYTQGGDSETEILFTVLTRLELSRLNTLVEKIDPKAFIFMVPVNEIRGGIIKKRPLH